MSVEDVARDVGRILSGLPLAALEQAHHTLSEAHEVLAEAVQGANDPEIAQTASLLPDAVKALGAVYQQISRAKQALEDYLTKVGPVDAPAPTAGRPAAQKAARSPAQPARRDPIRIEQLRATLPPPVPRPNPEGRKTHGRWVDTDGRVQELTSGHDEHSEEAWHLLKQAGLLPARRPAVVDHVEMKLATRMVQRGTRHTELVVNNRPCGGFLGCDALLPVILPEGYSLTVHGPNYRKTFTGGKQWSS